MKRTLYNLAMFAIAPFVGLVYMVMLPWVIVALAAWYGLVHALPEAFREAIRETCGDGAVTPWVWIDNK